MNYILINASNAQKPGTVIETLINLDQVMAITPNTMIGKTDFVFLSGAVVTGHVLFNEIKGSVMNPNF